VKWRSSVLLRRARVVAAGRILLRLVKLRPLRLVQAASMVGAHAPKEYGVDAVVAVAGEEGASSTCSRRCSTEWWEIKA
jgi:hypothetical protein